MPVINRSKANANGLRPTVRKVPRGTRPDSVRPNNPPIKVGPDDAEPARLPPWRSNGFVLIKDGNWDRPKPIWRRRPLDYTPAAAIEDEELFERFNGYFEDCFDNDHAPTLSDMTAHAGYESVVQMVNDARRHGPVRMRGMSRAILAIQAHYEELAQLGHRHALAILERIPQFDSREAPEQIATRAFEPRPEQHVVQVTGLQRAEDQGRELSPIDAYNQIIQKPSFQEIANAIDVSAGEDGVFSLPDLEVSDDNNSI